ncbi:MAG: alpha-ketoacid dehydrogenase subunit beta [Nitrospira sp.]|uniref:alpha-ketoacid dehydrogenase subunit beta n=1 Tax=Nitrospira sp. BLG_1 TaxID=3395883 RepID=UPI0039BD8BCA|nr:alpha-ketoacid dehydrogenase subunit beta [Nitrospira sp.]
MRDVAERQLTFAEAIRESLDQAMEKDSRVIVIGEGVPDPKAIFNTTAGLRQKYGARRVFDMPLSENGLTGACIGAALSGMRPVMIHQRIDFALLAMDQLVNNAAKWHYMFDGKASVPMVVRMIVGRGWGQGPQHSQSLQAMFAMVPGIKVVMPTTAYDAKGMMIAAIEDDNPVLFIEHRWLHHVADSVPDHYYRVPIGTARILHEGSDVTVAAFSYMAFEALIAAKSMLTEMGVGLEVIDMRTVRPLDVESVLTSVRKTGRLIVADTAFRTGSIAGELISQVVEQSFASLTAPPVRIASPDFPTPTSHFMAEDYYPGPKTIADAALDLMGKSRETGGYQRMSAAFVRKGPHDVPNREFSGPF